MAGERDESLDEEALEWFVVMRDDEITEEVRSSFEQWRNRSEAHERAYRDAERLWSDLDLLAPHTVVPGGGRGGVALGRRKRMSVRRVAAAVPLLIAVAWLVLPQHPFADYRTGIGARATISLPDGSAVELGPDSAMDLDFDDRSRRVVLLGGEAYFTVAKDASRAFEVRAGEGEIRVLGTEFNVDIQEDVSVAVAHNSVEVTADGGAVRIGTGDMVRYGASGLSAPMPADIEAIQAWRRDRLVYRDVQLSEIIKDLKRYKRGRIEIAGANLAQERLTAVFDARDPDEVIAKIADGLGLRVYTIPGVLTVLARQ
ncbi:FecR family protein [Ensifer sp.]|jgi:transmembrane sensor|uniref:FecR family protein n=1 Tax=Ensifer sp. TaxID=1872086 RepID=UPI002E100905|nr:FecR family protein [Ensifer sp.]